MGINAAEASTTINNQQFFPSRIAGEPDLLLSSAAIMVATQKLYPRATVKRIVKAHANRNVSKNADILVSGDRLFCIRSITDDRLLILFASIRSSWTTCFLCRSKSYTHSPIAMTGGGERLFSMESGYNEETKG